MSENGVWQELLRNKYLTQHTLSEVKAKPTDSPFWKGLLRVKDQFFNRGRFQIGNGKSTRFWEDIWLGDIALKHQYPNLYNIIQRSNVTVEHVLSHQHPNIQFRRLLT